MIGWLIDFTTRSASSIRRKILPEDGMIDVASSIKLHGWLQ